MGERERRLGKNENLFREVNERIHDLSEDFDVARARLGRFVCECADPGCTAAIELSGADYERVRADATHFFVVPGHEKGEVERIVERHEHWLVVEKREGDAAETAREGDPRN